jgi:hypothetical protein
VHEGWLPPNAVTPLPTPKENEIIDVTIESDSAGYLLIWQTRPSETCRDSMPPKSGDTWHQTIEDAEATAREYFGIEAKDWVDSPLT